MATRTGVRTTESLVLSTVEHAYRRAGLVTEIRSGFGAEIGPRSAPAATVRIRGIQRLECLVPDRAFTPLVGGIEDEAAEGWEIVVLAPIEHLGEAHLQLRGCPASLQGWWIDGEEVRFTRPQIP